MSSVSLVMVVKNEAKTLARAVSSVFEFVDEVIIGVDRSSSDNTYAIAKKWVKLSKMRNGKGQVYKFDWKDSFADARNLAAQKATGDYIFVLDGHEYLLKESLAPLQARFNQYKDQDVASFSMVIFLQDSPGKSKAFQHRLYKKGYQYVGGIHNSLHLPGEPLTIGLGEVVIVHDRPESLAKERQAQRHEMYPRHFKKALEDNPNDLKANYYMGVWYANHRQWQPATEHFEKYLELSEWDIECAKVAGFAGMCYRELENYDKARELLKKATNYRWDCAQAWIELGDVAAILRDKLDPAEDRDQIDALVVEAEFYYTCAARCKFPLDAVFLDNDDYTWKPWVKLASLYNYCCEQLEDFTVVPSLIQACHTALQYTNIPEEIKVDVGNAYNQFLSIYRQAQKQVQSELQTMGPAPDPGVPILSGKIG